MTNMLHEFFTDNSEIASRNDSLEPNLFNDFNESSTKSQLK